MNLGSACTSCVGTIFKDEISVLSATHVATSTIMVSHVNVVAHHRYMFSWAGVAFSAINIRFLYCQEKYDFCKLALSILSSELNKTKWASRSSPMHTSLGPRCGQTCQGPKNPKWAHSYLCIWIKALEHLQRNQVNVSVFTVTHLQWLLSLTWFNFNPIMDRLSHAHKSVGWNYLSIPKLQRWNRCSLGMDKCFIPHFIVDVITYSCWD